MKTLGTLWWCISKTPQRGLFDSRRISVSGRYLLLFQLDACVLGFEHLKLLYSGDEDFGNFMMMHLKNTPKMIIWFKEGFLFKGTRLCVPKCSTRELLIREAHGGSLVRHYGETKTLTILKEHYYWHGMHKDVQEILKRCTTLAKSHLLPQGLYTPLPVPTQPWIDVSMDLFWVCLDLRGAKIPYLWWGIRFQKWPILYSTIRLALLLILQICISRKWLDCVAFHDPLF